MQPSGNPHLGNYLGAMRQHVALQNSHECLYFIANLHALTTMQKGPQLREKTRELAVDYLALGIDPEKTIFFRQSDVPEVTELTWIFDTITPMGLLERAHAWKDAMQKGNKKPSVGLFNYPVLMAVDILIYKPQLVPVGQDQKQHVEIAADIADHFNTIYGQTFPYPWADIREDVAVVPGTDGQKMSKSYGNTIDIFAPQDLLRKQVFSIQTDSCSVDEPKNPEACIPFKLLRLLSEKAYSTELADRLQKGGLGYADVKRMLFERILDYFDTARQKRLELLKKPDYVEEVLREGAKKARKIAQATMAEVREKIGI